MNFPCPLCHSINSVKINRKSRPYFRCDKCGVLMFVNKTTGIRKLEKGSVCQTKTAAQTLDSFFEAAGD